MCKRRALHLPLPERCIALRHHPHNHKHPARAKIHRFDSSPPACSRAYFYYFVFSGWLDRSPRSSGRREEPQLRPAARYERRAASPARHPFFISETQRVYTMH